jgi:hypothetical protein
MGLFIAAALRLGRVGCGLGGFGAGRVHLEVSSWCVCLAIRLCGPFFKSNTTYSTAYSTTYSTSYGTMYLHFLAYCSKVLGLKDGGSNMDWEPCPWLSTYSDRQFFPRCDFLFKGKALKGHLLCYWRELFLFSLPGVSFNILFLCNLKLT